MTLWPNFLMSWELLDSQQTRYTITLFSAFDIPFTAGLDLCFVMAFTDMLLAYLIFFRLAHREDYVP